MTTSLQHKWKEKKKKQQQKKMSKKTSKSREEKRDGTGLLFPFDTHISPHPYMCIQSETRSARARSSVNEREKKGREEPLGLSYAH